MNMDRELVNRALMSIGAQPLTDTDIAERNSNFLSCKEYYLQCFLEALSEVPRTGGRKRGILMKTRRDYKRNGYAFCYDLPFDCAKPLELQGNEFFKVEDRFLYTDRDKAELLYVSNGKVIDTLGVILEGVASEADGDVEYVSGAYAYDCGTEKRGDRDGFDVALSAADLADNYDADGNFTGFENDEDYPEYIEQRYEPKFYEYVEKLFAAKFAVKVSERPDLHALLLSEAAIIKTEAIRASSASVAAKKNPSGWWFDEINKTGRERERLLLRRSA